jgi:ferredoxin, 2Fe-2S
MVKVTFVNSDGTKTTVQAETGDSAMQAAVTNDIEGIIAECGGSMMCATCHVYVADPFDKSLPSPSENEDEMLEYVAGELKENSRLSCQIELSPALDGIVLHIPEPDE